MTVRRGFAGKPAARRSTPDLAPTQKRQAEFPAQPQSGSVFLRPTPLRGVGCFLCVSLSEVGTPPPPLPGPGSQSTRADSGSKPSSPRQQRWPATTRIASDFAASSRHSGGDANTRTYSVLQSPPFSTVTSPASPAVVRRTSSRSLDHARSLMITSARDNRSAIVGLAPVLSSRSVR